MKRFFTKIVSFLLAVAILSTTTSFSMNAHYCCNEIVDIAIMSNARSCYETPQKTPLKKCTPEDQSCCNNKSFVKIGDNLQTVLFDYDYDYNSFVFLSTFFHTYVNLFKGLKNQVVPFKQYVPPLVSKDIIVLHETFLI